MLKHLCLIKHRTMRQKSEWSQSSTQSSLRHWKGWIISFTPWPFYPRANSPISLLNRRLDGLQGRSERLGEGFIAPALNGNTILCLSSPLDGHRINWTVSVPVVYAGQYFFFVCCRMHWRPTKRLVLSATSRTAVICLKPTGSLDTSLSACCIVGGHAMGPC
jgi:hypothetical protein